MSKPFLSTQELYGVEPKELADMKYKDALEVMRTGLWERKKVLVDSLFATTDSDIASQLQDAFRKVMKAIDLMDLKIEEIK